MENVHIYVFCTIPENNDGHMFIFYTDHQTNFSWLQICTYMEMMFIFYIFYIRCEEIYKLVSYVAMSPI